MSKAQMKQAVTDRRLNSPRIGEHADEPGIYELLIRGDKELVDPNGKIRMYVMITGYGEFSAGKVLVYPPPVTIVEGKSDEKGKIVGSSIRFGVRKGSDGKSYFGGEHVPLSEDGHTVDLGMTGIQYGNWKKPTVFIDNSDSKTPQVATEIIHREGGVGERESVVMVDLDICGKASPGQHSVHFAMTYFNGSEWRNSKVAYDFTVRTHYERHPFWYWAVGTVLALIELFT